MDSITMTKVSVPNDGNCAVSSSNFLNMQMDMHFSTHKNDVSLAQGFQKHLSGTRRKHVVVDYDK